MPFALPPLAEFTWKPTDLTLIVPSALGLAIVTAVNVLITSRVVEHFQGRHRGLRPADADAELAAYGIANLFAGALRSTDERGNPGAERGQRPLRRFHPALDSTPRSGAAGTYPVWFKAHRHDSAWRLWRASRLTWD